MKTGTGKSKFFRNITRYVLFVAGGIIIGWLIFHSPHKIEEKHEHTQVVQDGKATIWTCAMHPQIRMSEPGKCPICGMNLIPLVQNGSPVDPDAIHFSKEAIQLANVLTSPVKRENPVKEIRLFGKVKADERLLQNQVAHIQGRIEKLFVNFNGESVSRGQKLALIYSPLLVTAQQELLEAAKTKGEQPEIYEAAREKLRLLKITDEQIDEIEKSNTVRYTFEITSGTNGIVMAIRVKNGDYVSEGTVLYDVADLSNLWVLFDAYESDIEFLKRGDKLSFTLQALPGKKFTGNITFIDPVIDPVTRVARVRVEVSNQSGRMKPEMFATGIVSVRLPFNDAIVVPASAVLWTGRRSVVYVKQSGAEPVFKLRSIELGPDTRDGYVVTAGLTDGEEIVTRGTFSVDAAAQLEGKPSMMNPAGSNVSAGMEGMDMTGITKK
ncbi:MAG: efflux RND transporter periplasmic adaptor subunit [Bacteroidales bacterium]